MLLEATALDPDGQRLEKLERPRQEAGASAIPALNRQFSGVVLELGYFGSVEILERSARPALLAEVALRFAKGA